ncbi:hypothetical protein V474_23180 [Novosphingobium barchaimii LL02]|uniref:Uncharacterized protein n=1 Tax=Novosphingobium barchaimii LL02 TaxID=1114963 RepID=A0A0J7XPM7_9SPHN|nr:hypothetical protein V474_23180 [Novosphingobium barchaimii LL02]
MDDAAMPVHLRRKHDRRMAHEAARDAVAANRALDHRCHPIREDSDFGTAEVLTLEIDAVAVQSDHVERNEAVTRRDHGHRAGRFLHDQQVDPWPPPGRRTARHLG